MTRTAKNRAFASLAIMILASCGRTWQQPYAQNVEKASVSRILLGDLQLLNVPPEHTAALQAEWARVKPDVARSLERVGFEVRTISDTAGVVRERYEVLGRRALQIDRKTVGRLLGEERLILVPVVDGEVRLGRVARGNQYCPNQRWIELGVYYVAANQDGLVFDSNDFGPFPQDPAWKLPMDGSRFRISLSELEVKEDRQCRMSPLKQVTFENRLNTLNPAYLKGLKK